MNLKAFHINVISISGLQQFIRNISSQWWCNKRFNRVKDASQRILYAKKKMQIISLL
jgi:hypothetical protein